MSMMESRTYLGIGLLVFLLFVAYFIDEWNLLSHETYGSIFVLLLIGILLCFPILLAFLIRGRLNERSSGWHLADQEELDREDDVLLKGMGVLQATYFIYVGSFIDPKPQYLGRLSLLILLMTSSFFILRGKARISKSNVWRFYSIFAAFSVLAYDLLGLFFEALPPLNLCS